uniref:Transposase Tc1-like domain-containing protein n=1 Tax=Denticeps clupeoides TaxID=299321 RepID=A0AAY4C8L1_9TELE
GRLGGIAVGGCFGTILCSWLHRTTGKVHDRPRSGAPRVTDRNGDQNLRTYALRHRYATPTQLQATSMHVSTETVRNRLHDGGVKVRHPQVGVVLTTQHRRACLSFAREHQDWQIRHWRPVIHSSSYTEVVLINFIFDECDEIYHVMFLTKQKLDFC